MIMRSMTAQGWPPPQHRRQRCRRCPSGWACKSSSFENYSASQIRMLWCQHSYLRSAIIPFPVSLYLFSYMVYCISVLCVMVVAWVCGVWINHYLIIIIYSIIIIAIVVEENISVATSKGIENSHRWCQHSRQSITPLYHSGILCLWFTRFKDCSACKKGFAQVGSEGLSSKVR